jgi:sulfite reductase (NADPH) flavoprotein alpha-component
MTMIAEAKLSKLKELIEGSSEKELIWINGYLSGLVSAKTFPEPAPKSSVPKLTLVFGTDTGNSKKIATGFAQQLKRAGIQIKLHGLDQYRVTDLLKEEYFLLVISTHGDGEPPAAAKKFYEYIHSNSLSLPGLKYAVLALGDMAYPLFCKAGEDVDVRLKELGGTPLLPIEKCDTDFEGTAADWLGNILKTFNPVATDSRQPQSIHKRTIGKKNFKGTILSNINLNGRGSAKQTHHIELAVTNVAYDPGDSLGVVPENPVELIKVILSTVATNGNKRLNYRNEEISLQDLLIKKLNITYLPERVVHKYADIVQQEIPSIRMDLLNLLKIYPVKDEAQFDDVISILEPITPRLYSIASSLSVHESEVHLTVVRNCFTVNHEMRFGLCSDYLSNLPTGTSIEFYVHKNSEFKLPAFDKDIIMIGPGTGIAPFRSFIEERNATGASGRNWLFYGDQHFESDFLYQTEIQNYLELGTLTQVDVAFSRDQTEKIYVQHKMMKHGREFFTWLESGAHVYLCGAKSPMGDDIELSLAKVIEKFGNKSPEQAQDYLNHLKEEGRYQKDLY